MSDEPKENVSSQKNTYLKIKEEKERLETENGTYKNMVLAKIEAMRYLLERAAEIDYLLKISQSEQEKEISKIRKQYRVKNMLLKKDLEAALKSVCALGSRNLWYPLKLEIFNKYKKERGMGFIKPGIKRKKPEEVKEN